MKLFFKFIIVIATIVTVGIGLTSVFFFSSIQNMMRLQITDRRLSTARQTAARIDQYLYERDSDLRTLSAGPGLARAATPGLASKSLTPPASSGPPPSPTRPAGRRTPPAPSPRSWRKRWQAARCAAMRQNPLPASPDALSS
jgi:hypothetical protein